MIKSMPSATLVEVTAIISLSFGQALGGYRSDYSDALTTSIPAQSAPAVDEGKAPTISLPTEQQLLLRDLLESVSVLDWSSKATPEEINTNHQLINQLQQVLVKELQHSTPEQLRADPTVGPSLQGAYKKAATGANAIVDACLRECDQLSDNYRQMNLDSYLDQAGLKNEKAKILELVKAGNGAALKDLIDKVLPEKGAQHSRALLAIEAMSQEMGRVDFRLGAASKESLRALLTITAVGSTKEVTRLLSQISDIPALRETVIMGLALAGTPEAWKALQKLWDDQLPGLNNRATLFESLETLQAIAQAVAITQQDGSAAFISRFKSLIEKFPVPDEQQRQGWIGLFSDVMFAWAHLIAVEYKTKPADALVRLSDLHVGLSYLRGKKDDGEWGTWCRSRSAYALRALTYPELCRGILPVVVTNLAAEAKEGAVAPLCQFLVFAPRYTEIVDNREQINAQLAQALARLSTISTAKNRVMEVLSAYGSLANTPELTVVIDDNLHTAPNAASALVHVKGVEATTQLDALLGERPFKGVLPPEIAARFAESNKSVEENLAAWKANKLGADEKTVAASLQALERQRRILNQEFNFEFAQEVAKRSLDLIRRLGSSEVDEVVKSLDDIGLRSPDTTHPSGRLADINFVDPVMKLIIEAPTRFDKNGEGEAEKVQIAAVDALVRLNSLAGDEFLQLLMKKTPTTSTLDQHLKARSRAFVYPTSSLTEDLE